MEVAIEDRLPTYSGGLGVLAGDVLRAAADVGLPMVGVTLLYNRGFFRQTIDSKGRQHEAAVRWHHNDLLEELPIRVRVQVGERRVSFGHGVSSCGGSTDGASPCTSSTLTSRATIPTTARSRTGSTWAIAPHGSHRRRCSG